MLAKSGERRLAEPHQAVGLAVRQRLKENAVDDAEDGRVGADPERQRDERDGREPRVPGQHAQAVANVLEQDAHVASGPRGASLASLGTTRRGLAGFTNRIGSAVRQATISPNPSRPPSMRRALAAQRMGTVRASARSSTTPTDGRKRGNMPDAEVLKAEPVLALLGLRMAIDAELLRRGAIRSRRDVLGDWAETLVARTVGGTLAKESAGHDVVGPDDKVPGEGASAAPVRRSAILGLRPARCDRLRRPAGGERRRCAGGHGACRRTSQQEARRSR